MSNPHTPQTSCSSIIYLPIPLKLQRAHSKSGALSKRTFTPPHTPSPREVLLKRFESEPHERPSNAHSQDDKFKELARKLTSFDNDSLLQQIEFFE